MIRWIEPFSYFNGIQVAEAEIEEQLDRCGHPINSFAVLFYHLDREDDNCQIAEKLHFTIIFCNKIIAKKEMALYNILGCVLASKKDQNAHKQEDLP